MNSQLQAELQNTFNEELSTAFSVGSIIEDYFGEGLVDVQIPLLESALERCLNEDISCLVNIVNATEEIVELRDVKNNIVSIDRQQYLNESAKNILSDDIDPIYVPLVLKQARSVLVSYIHTCSIPIIIRFPRVRVTNENDKYIDITELYAKVDIKYNGCLRNYFTLQRAEYTMTQWLSHYSHSHMPSTEFRWQEPCLGSGPIGSTQRTLSERCDMNMWGLFCYELAKYVTVESIAGVPYRRLENVGTGNNMDFEFTVYNPFDYDTSVAGSIRKEFIRYFVREFNFPLSYVNGAYTLGDSLLNFVRKATDLFASWYNKKVSEGVYAYTLGYLKSRNIVVEALVSDGHICRRSSEASLQEVERLQGTPLFMFKGKEVTANFTEGINTDSSNTVILLSPELIAHLLTKILRIINYKYGNSKSNSSGSSEEETPSGEKYYFI